MREPSWRDVLETITSDPAERERIALEVGVGSITIVRWIRNKTDPRPINLRRLLASVPAQYQQQLLELLLKEFPELGPPSSEAAGDLTEELPPGVINEVLLTRATESAQLLFWTISRQVLQSALRQFDPEQLGMAISVLQCMPPASDGKIHSLREVVGLGTSPWKSEFEPKALFLGAESLAGHTLTSGHLEQIADLSDESSILPAHRFEHEVSAVAHPIMYAGHVAGCFLLSSTQPGYFLPPARQVLIQRYANLVALAFEIDDYYPPDVVELRVMPPFEQQQPYLASYWQRVFTLMTNQAAIGPMIMRQAEQLVWQELEEVLLHLSA